MKKRRGFKTPIAVQAAAALERSTRKERERLANLAAALAKPQGKSKRIIGMKCTVLMFREGKRAECGEFFPCKKKGDIGSYNIAGYQNHLRTDHNIFLPKPTPVEGF